jgi:NAD(P)-dependent dehydrogenase (short-subunit alcohol dehydrogenase family)
MEELAGKVAVVTGAASGIGLALAQRFAGEGMHLVLADIEEAVLAGVAKELADAGTEVLAVRIDVSVPAQLDELAAAAKARFGTFHVVCNNAGVAGHGGPSWGGAREEWEWVLGVNLWGVVDGLRAFVPTLVEQDEGHVVNTASVAGLGALPFLSPYSATKHAVVGLSEGLFYELALTGSQVGVTVLCPGFVRTNLHESTRNWPDRFGAEPVNEHPAGAFIEQLVRDQVEGGSPPEALAEQVVAAIRERRFLVTTDPELAGFAAENRTGEVRGEPPALPPLT